MRIPPAWAILAALVPASAIFGEEPKVSGAADSPPILVLVAEQGVDDGAPVAWWTRGGDPRGRTATAPRTAESVLVAEWQGAGIRIAPSDAAGRRLARERIGAASLTGAQARAAGRIAGATIVVHGTSVATTEDESSGMLEQTAGMKPVRGRACIAVLTLTAHRADTGEVLASAEGTARSTERNPGVCGRSATEKATREVAAAFRQRVLAAWQGR